MTVLTQVQKMLDRHHIPYRMMPHAETSTAKETGRVLCMPIEEMAKTVIVKANGRYVMLVLPADERVDLAKAARLLGAKSVRLATEEEMHRLFPDCEIGAMPPFGELYGMEELVDHGMIHRREIACEAGTHREAIMLKTGDFMAMAHPTIADFHTDARVTRKGAVAV